MARCCARTSPQHIIRMTATTKPVTLGYMCLFALMSTNLHCHAEPSICHAELLSVMLNAVKHLYHFIYKKGPGQASPAGPSVFKLESILIDLVNCHIISSFPVSQFCFDDYFLRCSYYDDEIVFLSCFKSLYFSQTE